MGMGKGKEGLGAEGFQEQSRQQQTASSFHVHPGFCPCPPLPPHFTHLHFRRSQGSSPAIPPKVLPHLDHPNIPASPLECSLDLR